MHKKNVIFPFVIILFALAGFTLRSVELRTVIDKNTGLAERGAFVTTALAALSVLVLLFALLWLLHRGNLKVEGSFFGAFSSGRPTTFVALFACALLLAVGSVCAFLVKSDILNLITAIFQLAAAFAVAALALSLMNNSRYKLPILGIAIILFYALLLVNVYRQYTAEPELLSYVYKILALVFALLSVYCCIGFDFGRVHPRRAMFCCAAAVYFLIVNFADGGPAHFLLPEAAAALFALTGLFRLSANSTADVVSGKEDE